jgi:hypothetical protein
MTKPGRAALARARALYDANDVSLAAIAKGLKLSPAAFRALRQREQWPARGQGLVHAETDDASLDTQALERRLVRALRREIARAESEIEQTAPPGAERKARILGLLVKTLGDLRKLNSDDRAQTQKAASDDTDSRDRDTRDLAALRQALARRLGDLRKQGRDE